MNAQLKEIITESLALKGYIVVDEFTDNDLLHIEDKMYAVIGEKSQTVVSHAYDCSSQFETREMCQTITLEFIAGNPDDRTRLETLMNAYVRNFDLPSPFFTKSVTKGSMKRNSLFNRLSVTVTIEVFFSEELV